MKDNYLEIDKQTLSDLGFYGKGPNSIYAFFASTKTEGGRRKLTEYFQKPLADAEAINRRSSIIKYFSEHSYDLPVDAATLSTMAFYLENTDERSQLSTKDDSLFQKVRDLIASDASEIHVKEGIDAFIRCFQGLCKFMTAYGPALNNSPFQENFQRINRLIDSDAMRPVKELSTDLMVTRLNATTLSTLDLTLRFQYREISLQLVEYLFDLDVLLSVAAVANVKKMNFATALPSATRILKIKGIYHLRVNDPIPNDIELQGDSNVLFLTGANMAGKSTLMKSMGIAVYLAQMGFPVPCKEMFFSVFDGMYTSINLSDNLKDGASHYYAEVLRVKQVAVALKKGKSLFVIFDELFRGTNVKDALDATVAISSAFSHKKNSRFIISTHIMEAGQQLQEKTNVISYQYLPTETSYNDIFYPRILKEGISNDRQGMMIIEKEEILSILDKGLMSQNLNHGI